MDQETLKNLLEEAAAPDCGLQRRSQIQVLLGDAVFRCGADKRGDGIRVILDSLYCDIIQHRPELLPTMFPAFAIMCGENRDGMIIASVDWSLVD